MKDNNTPKSNRKKLTILIITLVVLLLSLGISYAYLNTVFKGNSEEVTIKGGNITLQIDDINIVTKDNMMPGDYIEKQFKITNTGQGDTTYDVYFSDVFNTFNTKSELVYTISSDDGGKNVNSETTVPDEATKIISAYPISVGEVHTYTIKILYKDKVSGNDINNMGKEFKAKIKVNEYTDYPIATLDTGSSINCILKELAEPERTGVNYLTSNTNIKSIQKANALDETKDYVNIASSTSKYPVYAWFDNTDDQGIVYYYTDAEKIYMNTNSSSMFRSLEKIELLDLSFFDSSRVTSMEYMFTSLKEIKTLDLSNFDTSNVTNMSNMFFTDSKLESLDLSNFDTSNVTRMNWMFMGANNLEYLDISSFNTSNVTDMSNMFGSLSKLSTLDLSHFDTSKVTTMSGMFSGMSSLTSLNVSNFNTSNVVSMFQMFYNCRKLSSLDLGHFETTQVKNMSQMFYYNESLTSLNVSSFNTSNVTNMSSMFRGMKSITNLNLSNFNTSNVTNMQSMFNNLESIIILDLTSFDISNVTNVGSTNAGSNNTEYGMFSGCKNLETIYVNPTTWNTSNVTQGHNMFYQDNKLVGGAGTTYDSSHLDVSYAHVDGGVDNPGYLTLKTNA